MALPAKFRVKKFVIDTPVEVSLRSGLEPDFVVFKHPSWTDEKRLTALGDSTTKELTGLIALSGYEKKREVKAARQIIFADDDANVYEGVVQYSKQGGADIAFLRVIQTIPDK
jgi:hypothetical protein